MFTDRIKTYLSSVKRNKLNVTVLSGAGISAESGVPTFRGKEGYWTEGSDVYTPEEMATNRMFSNNPERVWRWYIYRFLTVSNVKPNDGHYALTQIENSMGDQFQLITQNVDHLHFVAGSRRIFCIHGDISYMRCFQECSDELYPMPPSFLSYKANEELASNFMDELVCPKCGSITRPHVLWFDEYYNDTFYHFNQSIQTAINSDLLIVVGTSGATNLPNQIVQQAYRNGSTILDINIERNPFSHFAESSPNGVFLEGKSGYWLKKIAEYIEK